jgi:lipid II:glycine glycyltransferase (peptidoglycan interpeptide bridge formation enzyme)
VNHPLQTREWEEFRKKAGNEVLRINSYLLTIHPIPFTPFKIGVFLKGPKPTEKMLKVLRKIGKEKNLVFIRMEPNVPYDKKLEEFLRKQGAVPGRPFFTKTTFVIDLTKQEEELLRQMHPKTRYNIRLAQRYGVEVDEDNSDKAFEKYLDLTEETTKRQNFFAHTERYHRLMWQLLKTKNHKPKANKLTAHLLTARYQGEILVTWILFVFKDTLYYPYGASSIKHKNVMASYAMMWSAIKFGKKLGLKKFDLWGREEGKGFTRFKEGFGPQVVEFLGTWDIIFKPIVYKFYRILESLRWYFLKSPLPLPKPKFR